MQCTTETKSRAVLGKVSQSQHSSHQLSLLDLQVAGLQGCANTLGPARPGIEPGSPAYMEDALHSEILTTPVTMNKEMLTDDP